MVELLLHRQLGKDVEEALEFVAKGKDLMAASNSVSRYLNLSLGRSHKMQCLLILSDISARRN